MNETENVRQHKCFTDISVGVRYSFPSDRQLLPREIMFSFKIYFP